MNYIVGFITVLSWLILPISIWIWRSTASTLVSDKKAISDANRVGATGWDYSWARIARERKGALESRLVTAGAWFLFTTIWLCVRYFA